MHLKCGRFNHHQSFFDRGPAVVKSLTKGRSLGKTSECAAAAAAVVVMMMVCVCVCVCVCVWLCVGAGTCVCVRFAYLQRRVGHSS